MGIFKSYKKLYEIEKANNVLLIKRKREIYNDNIRLQKELKQIKEEKAKLYIELEDTKGFLEQEKEAKEELLRQRNKANARKRVARKKEENK